MRAWWVLLFLAGCPDKSAIYDPTPFAVRDADLFVDVPGEPAPLMPPSLQGSYDRGRAVVEHRFSTEEGLGPFFNADSCLSCHQFPVAGGSAPRYRDFFLIRGQRSDGGLFDLGTNGESPVLNLYATEDEGRHLPAPHGISVAARRNAPPGLGMGILHFIPAASILKHADPDDEDGDGISGRANYEQGRIGKFGYKSQAHDLESFNRGAAFNQMGITTDPLFHTEELFPPESGGTGELPRWWASLDRSFELGPSGLDLLLPVAFAQVAAPDQPTVDRDGVPDPEMSSDDLRDMLIYSIYLGQVRPPEPTAQVKAGAERFSEIGCDSCHVARLESTVGPVPLYSDLLLHDMGPALADGITMGLATGSEYRTQPLWGVSLHGPFLHDGRADSLTDAIEWHGGEAEASRERWSALPPAGKSEILAFLEGLGGWSPEGQVLLDPQTLGELPEVGSPGGPDRALSPSEAELWLRGRSLFDRTFTEPEGLGPFLNADSCRACHQQPVLGGAAGIDTSVIRVGHRDPSTGLYRPVSMSVSPRVVLPGEPPVEADPDLNVVETRQPQSLLGLGLLDRIPEEDILAGEDPDDVDGDGIRGVARRVTEHDLLGRFGWKAQIPTLFDFLADGLFNELGITANPELSSFTGTDDDGVPDPELPDDDYFAMAFYMSHLAPPQGRPIDPAAREAGAALFQSVGCDKCHTPSLGGVPAYTDLLLHDIAPDPMQTVDQEPGMPSTSFRTAPLWGVVDTPPYLHHGLAPTLHDAILGHGGEAEHVRAAYEHLSQEDRALLIQFIESL